MKGFFNSRKFRQGSVATVITVLGIAIVVVVNMIATTLSDRYSLRLDLTPSKVFGITRDTVDYLAGLTKDVDIYILNSEAGFTGNDQYLKQASEVISEYAKHSDYIHIQYIDLARNATFASRFPGEDTSVNNIIVSSGSKVKALSPYDLFDTEMVSYTSFRVLASKAEQTMTSTIVGVVSENMATIAILGGHDDTELAELRSQLATNNYTVVDVNILTSEIPLDATVAILSAPKRDYDADELKRLDNFLAGSDGQERTLLYLAGVDQPPVPALEAFLAEWNIGVGEGVVFDTDENRVLNMNPYFPIVDYAEGEFSANVQNKQLYTVIPTARPLSVLTASPDSYTSVLLQFSPQSGIQPITADENWRPTGADMLPGIPALVLGSRSVATGTATSHVLVCGSSYAVGDAFLASGTIGNAPYFMDVLGILTFREEGVTIQAKSMTTAQMGLTSYQIMMLSLVFVVILPLVLLIAGGFVFFRRRHL